MSYHLILSPIFYLFHNFYSSTSRKLNYQSGKIPYPSTDSENDSCENIKVMKPRVKIEEEAEKRSVGVDPYDTETILELPKST